MDNVYVRQVLSEFSYFIVSQEEDDGVVAPEGRERVGLREGCHVGVRAVDCELSEDDAVVTVTGQTEINISNNSISIYSISIMNQVNVDNKVMVDS